MTVLSVVTVVRVVTVLLVVTVVRVVSVESVVRVVIVVNVLTVVAVVKYNILEHRIDPTFINMSSLPTGYQARITEMFKSFRSEIVTALLSSDCAVFRDEIICIRFTILFQIGSLTPIQKLMRPLSA